MNPVRGRRGSNQYQTRGGTVTNPKNLGSDDVEMVAAAFAPDSDVAWEWAFPQWPAAQEQLRDAGFDAVTAHDRVKPLTDGGFGLRDAMSWAAVVDGTSVDQARRWAPLLDVVPVTELVDWCLAGFGPGHTRDAVDIGLSVDAACDLRNCGVDVSQVAQGCIRPGSVPVVTFPDDPGTQRQIIEVLVKQSTVSVADVTAALMQSQHRSFRDAAATVHEIAGFPDIRPSPVAVGRWRSLVQRYLTVGVRVEDALSTFSDLSPRAGLTAANPHVHGSVRVVTDGQVTEAETAATVAGLRRWLRYRQQQHRPTGWAWVADDLHDTGWVDPGGRWRHDPIIPALTQVFPHDVHRIEQWLRHNP